MERRRRTRPRTVVTHISTLPASNTWVGDVEPAAHTHPMSLDGKQRPAALGHGLFRRQAGPFYELVQRLHRCDSRHPDCTHHLASYDVR